MISSARKTDGVFWKESNVCFNSEEGVELMEGVRFGNEEKVGWVMAAVLRGVKNAYAPCLLSGIVCSFFPFFV